jgi:hypothetical protein
MAKNRKKQSTYSEGRDRPVMARKTHCDEHLSVKNKRIAKTGIEMALYFDFAAHLSSAEPSAKT